MKPFHLLLALIMMITGSINTITTKFADIQCAIGIPNYRSGMQNSSSTTFAKAKNANPCVQWMDKTSCNKKNSDNCQWVNYQDQHHPKPKPNTTEGAAEVVGWCDNNDCRISTLTSGGAGAEKTGEHLFDHPFVQSLTMFIGEFMCLFAFKLLLLINSWRGIKPEAEEVATEKPPRFLPAADSVFAPCVFAIPALCDSVATTTMYIGLTMTYASSFQMLRGAVVIFTGILSKFAGEDLGWTHVTGMFVVLGGLMSVGGAAFLKQPVDNSTGNASSGPAVENMPHEITGDMLIMGAQVVVACQMVIESQLMKWYKVQPLQLVGYEGFFGCIYMTLFCILFYGQNGPRGGKFEDAYDAIAQMKNSPNIQLALVGTIFSIAIFNWSGVSITKHMSATTRMVIDSLRTIIIWVLGLLFKDGHTVATDAKGSDKPHWESFETWGPGWLQILGFILLLGGSATFNRRTVIAEGKPAHFSKSECPEYSEPLIYPLFRSKWMPCCVCNIFQLPGDVQRRVDAESGDRTPLLAGSKGSVNYANA